MYSILFWIFRLRWTIRHNK